MNTQEYEQRKSMLAAAYAAATRNGDERRAADVTRAVQRLNEEWALDALRKGGPTITHYEERRK